MCNDIRPPSLTLHYTIHTHQINTHLIYIYKNEDRFWVIFISYCVIPYTHLQWEFQNTAQSICWFVCFILYYWVSREWLIPFRKIDNIINILSESVEAHSQFAEQINKPMMLFFASAVAATASSNHKHHWTFSNFSDVCVYKSADNDGHCVNGVRSVSATETFVRDEQPVYIIKLTHWW